MKKWHDLRGGFLDSHCIAWSPGYTQRVGSPQIYSPPVRSTVVRGRLLRLTCLMKGRPSPTVTWSLNNVTITENSRIVVGFVSTYSVVPLDAHLPSLSFYCFFELMYYLLIGLPRVLYGLRSLRWMTVGYRPHGIECKRELLVLWSFSQSVCLSVCHLRNN